MNTSITKTLLLICIVWLSPLLSAEAIEPPLFLVRESPGRLSAGFYSWNTPVLAAYADGRVIYRTGWRRDVGALREGRITNHNVLLDQIRALTKKYAGQKFVAGEARDDAYIGLWCGGNTLEIEGYRWETRDRSQASSIPAPILDAIDRLVNFNDDASKQWMPEKISVVLTACQKGALPAVPWPDEWPKLGDEAVDSTGAPTLIKIMLDSRWLEQLHRTYFDQNRRVAVSFANSDWAIQVLLPIPGEEIWRK